MAASFSRVKLMYFFKLIVFSGICVKYITIGNNGSFVSKTGVFLDVDFVFRYSFRIGDNGE